MKKATVMITRIVGMATLKRLSTNPSMKVRLSPFCAQFQCKAPDVNEGSVAVMQHLEPVAVAMGLSATV
ncbi:hypothetical protein [uncultured Maricaulis sp.]|uniref:hypothetical protein n=1 Tax=uncultured Maricaulis sp. TaxID=174710 RepID=UPI0026223FC7|nr:hypothetical protein [uncultured Maricaulis sp.]